MLVAYFGLGALRGDAGHDGDRPLPRLHPVWPDSDLRHSVRSVTTRLHDRPRHPRQRPLSRRDVPRSPSGYLTYTKGGRTIYAVGSNKEAARAAGLSVLFYSVLPYVVSGALRRRRGHLLDRPAPFGGPADGQPLELDAIAAVVIGGASLFGGRGSIIGTLIGVLIMVMIRNGLNLLGVSPFWQGSAIGSIIIVALLVERLVSARAGR